MLRQLPVRIPLYDLAADHRAMLAELGGDLARVCVSGRFVLGPEVEGFEREFSNLLGSDHAVGVNSGTDALVLGLTALGIGPGDEVVTPPFTFVATAEAVVRAGATPVFCDVEPDTLCLSPAAAAAAFTPRTRAVIAVHVFGHCTDLDTLAELCRSRGIALVEDACQAVGAQWRGRMLGSIGSFGAFSFYPTKNLGALGDAGALVTSDRRLADEARSLRDHGRDAAGKFGLVGWNSRLDELQAAFLRRKLRGLHRDLARRRELAQRYSQALSGLVRIVRGHDGCASAWHQFGLQTGRRDGLRRTLADAGIETGGYYPRPVYAEPALAPYAPPGPLPGCEQACREAMTLPIRPGLNDVEQAEVVAAIRRSFGR
ncbi:DegT/DnrJ/EryC1/StrS family aminotransferase [candidate division WOR-3 bacterium]|nr:DegT/DnrJ/EryC1/StrS family aminotransferase [candidate division WOR-3 bacterium]